MNLTYDVRVWSIRTYSGQRGKTYTVRWIVAGSQFRETFATRKLAEGFRAKLTTATREGVPFDTRTVLPQTMARAMKRRTWYEHATEFVDVKWPHASPRHRKNIAEALASVTIALLPTNARGTDEVAKIRTVLRTWAFNKAARSCLTAKDAVPPEADAARLRWIAENSPDLSQLKEAPVLRRALDALALKLDGSAAAAATVTRKRSAFYSALEYAVELEIFDANPIDRIQWTKPDTSDVVDRRVVVNPGQARASFRRARRSSGTYADTSRNSAQGLVAGCS